jgi:hypothetical protein
MKQENNHPLSKPLFSLLERLTALNGSLGLLNNQLDNYTSMFRQSFEDRGIDLSNAMAGFAFLLRDVSVPSEQKYLNYLPAGTFTKKGEQYLEAANEITGKWAAWSVAQSYESFETFLRDMATCYYFTWPPEKPLGNLEQIPIEYKNIEAWGKFFRLKQWNSFSLLAQLRLSAPSLTGWEKENILRVNLQDWHSLIAVVRHAIVHSNMVTPRSKFQVSAKVINSLLPQEFPGTWHGDEYSINFNRDTAKNAINLTGDYAYLVFKCLCIEKNIEWDLLQFSSK